MSEPCAGYTLPVFACAAAIAALKHLYDHQPTPQVTVALVNPSTEAQIAIEQVAHLKLNMALAITRSDPGQNLDLTRDTPIWALVERNPLQQTERICIQGGEGVGLDQVRGGQAAIYDYARRLLETNLSQHLHAEDQIKVTIILPEGRALAQRTSNAAFGVVEGLSLLGTSGIAQPLSAPGQLEAFRVQVQAQAQVTDRLVFCLGENGLDIARSLGIPSPALVKTANWLGPLLVEAGQQGITHLLLLGYHGKLIKLAGGIFHTHHHLADARLEILTATAAKLGLPTLVLQTLLNSGTTEDGLQLLRSLDIDQGSDWADQVYHAITTQIDRRSQVYIRTHCDRTVNVGSALFDRSRQIFAVSNLGETLLSSFKSAD